MEILQLKYFLDSAECGSFSLTSKKYRVPTTSVSASVRRLEGELGYKLFDRHANKITLNENGSRLKDALVVVFYEIDTAIADISAESDTRRINLLVRAMRNDISDYIVEFNRRHPSIHFNAVFDFNEHDYQKFDVVIDEKNKDYVGYSGFRLSDMRIRMKAARGKFKLPKKMKIADLSKQPFISWGDGSNMHRILLSACESAGFSPNVVVRLNDMECYNKMLRAGVGIGLARDFGDSDSPELENLDVTDFVERYTVFCYYNPKTHFGNIKSFVDFIKTKKMQSK